MKFLVQVVTSLLVIGVVIYAALKSGGRGGRAAFNPNPATDKNILVQGWTEPELKQILRKFLLKYSDTIGTNFPVTIQTEANRFRLRFPNDFPPDGFQFLVNYVRYPEDFDLKGRALVVVGSATLGREFDIPDDALAGQKAQFYVPSNDRDYDVLYVRVGDQTFEDSFASSRWKLVKDKRLPPGVEF